MIKNKSTKFLDFEPLDACLTTHIKKSVKLTCIDSCSEYLLLGATTGSLYVFDRKTSKFIQLLSIEDIREPIVKIKFSPDERFLAIATSKPNIYVLEINVGKRLKAKRTLKMGYHKSGIKALEWGVSGDVPLLFSAEETGVVYKTKVQTSSFNVMGPDSEFLYQADSSVVQMKFEQKLNQLLISSNTRSIVIDFKKGTAAQIGKNIRDGPFGSTYYETLEGIIILSSRPGKRIWTSECDNPAKVKQTLNFQSSLSATEPQRLFLPPNIAIHVPSDKSINFHRILPFAECVVSWSERLVFFIDIEQHNIIQWHIDAMAIQDVTIYDNMLFILYSDTVGDLKLSRLQFNVDSYINSLISQCEWTRLLHVIHKYKYYNLDNLKAIIECIEKDTNNDSSDVLDILKLVGDIEKQEDERRLEELKLRQEIQHREELARQEVERHRKADIEKRLAEEVKQDLPPIEQPVIKENVINPVSNISSEEQDYIHSNTVFAPAVENVVEKTVKKKKKPIKKRVPKIQPPKKRSPEMPVIAKEIESIPVEIQSVSSSPNSLTESVSSDNWTVSSKGSVGDLRSSSTDKLFVKKEWKKVDASQNSKKSTEDYTTLLNDIIDKDDANQFLNLIGHPYAVNTDRWYHLFTKVIAREKSIKGISPYVINVSFIVTTLQDTFGSQDTAKFMLDMAEEDLKYVLTNVTPHFWKQLISNGRNEFAQASIITEILEIVDSYLWSPKPNVISPQINHIETLESERKLHSLIPTPIKSDNETIKLREPIPRCFGDHTNHWGYRINASKGTCGVCNLPLHDSNSKIYVFENCGHCFHEGCIEEEPCMLCLEKNFETLLPSDSLPIL